MGPTRGLPDLLAEIASQGGYESGFGPEPVVSLESFFEGNDDLGSIGSNLADHPGVQQFFTVLRHVRERPEVHDVWVGISEVMGDDEWPFSNHVYVVTSASADELLRWTTALSPEPEIASGWWNDVPPLKSIPVSAGMRVLTLWWD
ncbi:hypothetical protein KOI35_04035 [Actinoplanes bogorensis]|uniref:Uncharacterized protein n=1 Tax=Paractinoplanes bogorensis TaxID=1610840 RepID=A0ABS5YGQ1_9ACTN|nr:hypothetical protein [Actinoplanes bogorensis]MBU2662668.1 hypothetical protein [Actinoplanes bogorensis]